MSRGDGGAEKLGQPALGVELLPRLFGADQLPEEADSHGGLRVHFDDGVELLVGPLEIAGEAEQFGQESPLAYLGRMSFHLFAGGGDGLRQLARLVQFRGSRHGTVPPFSGRRHVGPVVMQAAVPAAAKRTYCDTFPMFIAGASTRW